MIRKYFQKLTVMIDNLTKENARIIFVVFSLIAVGICLSIGLAQSVWFDEAYSIELARKPISEIIRLTSLDVHPPLYYVLLHLWGNIFGWDELALRAMSVLFMGLAAYIAGAFTRKHFGNRAAIISIAMIALSPILLRYGFEIRMYSLASLIGIAATYCLTNATDENDQSKRRTFFTLYATLVAIGMLTLYYLALLWLAHFGWLIWRTVKTKKSVFKSEWLLAYIGSVLIFSPWLPCFIKQLTNGALAPISQAMTVENIIGIISFNFLYRPVWQLGALLSLVVMFLIVALVILTISAIKKFDKKQKDKVILTALYVLIPVVILALIGLVKPMYTERYLSHIAIGGLVFIGVIISKVAGGSRRREAVLAGLVVASMLVGLVKLSADGNYNFQRLQKPDIKTIAAAVEGCDENNVVLAADPYVATELGYYLRNCDVYFYSKDDKLGGGYAPLDGSEFKLSDPTNQLAGKESIYYAYYGDSKINMPSGFILDHKLSSASLTIKKFIVKR